MLSDWRAKEPTPKQRYFLWRCGMKVPGTRGKASDLIGAIIEWGLPPEDWWESDEFPEREGYADPYDGMEVF